MIQITDHQGFSVEFENGYSVSVQWGPGNYCSNQFSGFNPKEIDFFDSDTVECMIRDPQGWVVEHPSSSSGVFGWMTADRLIDLLYEVKNIKKGEEE